MSKNDNVKNSALGKFINAGLSEIDLKSKGEVKSSLALGYALLASDDQDTLSSWRIKLADFHNVDEKLQAASRTKFADYIGATQFLDTSGDKERKTQDYRNLMLRQYKRMQFAVDVHDLKMREFIVIHENAKGLVAHIKGDTELCRRVWNSKGWQDRKALTDKRSPFMDVLIAQRASTTQQGEVSWNGLADLVAGWMNRKNAGGSNKPVTISAKAPLGAIKAVQAVINGDPAAVAVHFSSVESKMQALETAEDIAAFAFEGDDADTTAMRKRFSAAVEEMREFLQSMIDRKRALTSEAA